MTDTTFGRYEIRSELGRGGMATVYHAFDPHFQRHVALKILPRVFMHDENFRERFIREARAVAVLEHWAIVPVHDYGEQDEQPFFVMRYMTGGSLLDRIQRGRLTLEEITPTIERVAAALDFAHRKDVVHRDVKPANILFDEGGDAYLSDFGIVKLAEATAQLTGSGIVGTPTYMAPEMMRKGGITPLIDVYALGVTLFQALTGQPPYEADTPMGTALAHTTQPIPDIVACCPDLPGAVQAVIEGALAKDPTDRYQSAGALAADLRGIASQGQPLPALETTLVESPPEPTIQEPAPPAELEVTLPDALVEMPEVTLPDAPPAAPEITLPDALPAAPTPPAAQQTAAPMTTPLPPTVKPASRGFPMWIVAVLGLIIVAGLAFAFWPRGGTPAEEPPAEEPVAEQPAVEGPSEAEEAAVPAGESGPLIVVIGTTDSVNSLDPADSYSLHDWELLRNVNRGLIGLVPSTADITPDVASGWEVSDDGLTWVFHIEEGWKYPDGSELTAADFVRGINRSLTLGGNVSLLITPFVTGVEAIDDYTLAITLSQVRGDFPQIVTSAPYLPVQAGAFPDDTLNPFPATLSGVGPYQITEYEVDEQVVLERNPYYKPGFAESAPDRVIVRYFNEPDEMVLALQSGEIDIAWRSLGPDQVVHLGEVEGLTLYNSGGGSTRFLVPNHGTYPMSSRNVRQALAYLVNRSEIVDRALQGVANPLYSPVPLGFVGANEVFLERYPSPDVEAAEGLLRADGYSEGNPLTFDLWYPQAHYGTFVEQVVAVLEEQFERTPLVQVEHHAETWANYVGTLTNCEYPIGYLGWFVDYPDTSSYLEPILSENGRFIGTCYASGEMNALLAAGRAETDPAARAAIYDEAQALFAEDVVTIPLFIQAEYAAFNRAAISGITISPTLAFNYELIEVAR
jgi:peptide/nickel transport system substrate-binding protein